jgi:hypothetical protein
MNGENRISDDFLKSLLLQNETLLSAITSKSGDIYLVTQKRLVIFSRTTGVTSVFLSKVIATQYGAQYGQYGNKYDNENELMVIYTEEREYRLFFDCLDMDFINTINQRIT